MNTKLANIANFKLGHFFREAIKFDASGEVLIITPKVVEGDALNLNLAGKMKERNFKQNAFLESKDVIINTRLNFRAVLYNGSQKSIATSPLVVIKVKNQEEVLPEYLSIFLNLKKTQNAILKVADVGAVRFVSLAELKNLEIFVPCLERQKKVVDFYSLATRQIEDYKKVLLLKEAIKNKVLNNFVYE